MTSEIDTLLQPFQRLGVHLGLERIQNLLAALDNPHHRVPIVHVAGSNGKGSTCAYLSSVLTEAGYRVGRYTSPHLIDWTERICLNEQPIPSAILAGILQQVRQAIPPGQESPTQFEIVTAAAWLYFAQSQVDIAIVEVGLGGRLDATNVCHRPLVTIITSLSREHWQHLGPTLADIAREKAGILKTGCPAVLGQFPPAAKEVVASRLATLNCPAVWVKPARPLPAAGGMGKAAWGGIEYPLPLLGEVQLMNSALAIAALQLLQQQGWQIPAPALERGMAKTRWLGRLQWAEWQGKPLLLDGAHNPAAAQGLRQYVDTLPQPVTWIMGMLSTKDHAGIFRALLRGGERLYLVPVPAHSTASPEALANLAATICPNLEKVASFADVFRALEAAKIERDRSLVLCGSLYLVGYFLQRQAGTRRELVK
jgi:dihydrofolate synthase/folylpolyglutamate synthase